MQGFSKSCEVYSMNVKRGTVLLIDDFILNLEVFPYFLVNS